MHAATLLQPLKTSTAGQSIILRLGTSCCAHAVVSATGLWDAESIIFNRGHSVALWTFTGRVFSSRSTAR